jgi:hypothetical protein
MSLPTIKATLEQWVFIPGVKYNAATHLLTLLDHFDNEHIGIMELKTKILKCKKLHKRTDSEKIEVNDICNQLLQHI